MEHVHLIGIGGTGLSAIARVLLESGYSVSGSDRTLSPLAQSLREAGVRVDLGHHPENVLGADRVVRSSAIPDENPEVQAALAAGIPVLKRSDFLGQLIAGREGIAVAGTHGKTTTTAMIAWVLTALGQDPSYIVGGVVKNLENNAHAGKGTAFVIEADEYDRMFLGLQPAKIVLTNVEHDHPDCFPTVEEYLQAFQDFIARLAPGGTLIACGDDAGAARLASWARSSGRRVLTYSLRSPADYQARDLKGNQEGGYSFTVVRGTSPLADIHLSVPGEHNVLNALAAFMVADLSGLSHADTARSLGSFQGTGRRFELLGEPEGIAIVDDYAHHPTEIRATLAAARSRYPDRQIWAVWQPHTYTRTRALFDGFASAFKDADRVVVTDVYAAREPVEAFSTGDLVAAMNHPGARHIAGISQVAEYLVERLQRGDVLLVLSAGDADQVSAQVLARLGKKEEANG